ncbi:Fic/DOC family N-terminal domain-containing protein [uncultured Microscilla sp.]|uniref:Fic family protein n=1 Tax=uncultured Microscilla sp. TaxID=432653 RepID=UPI00260557F2|nr:Fic/DOC family N-terminal domain-containing protein [uncultured Microscilla sp.]
MINFDKNQPYNGLPLLPPKVNLETTNILRKAITASRALAQLNGAITNLPNPTLLLDTIYFQEAKGSSEIENIITTNDELYKAVVADKKIDNSANKEVLHYKKALWLGLETLDSKSFITTNLCIQIVQCIKNNTSGIRKTSGTTLSNAKGETIYTPPSGEEIIRDKLSNLEKFINEDQALDPLIKMALMHYQFEAIHPFLDGNGRTGRILLLLYLKMEKLLDIPAIYLSEYIIQNKTAYYPKLRLVTEEADWEGWIIYMMDMIEFASQKGLQRLSEIMQLIQSMAQEIQEKLPKIYSKDLIEVLFKLPYTKRQFLINANLGNPKTVGNYLKELEKQGFLKSIKFGKEKLYLNHKLMAILEQS